MSVPDLRRLGTGGSDLQDEAVEASRVRYELDSARGLELAVTRMDGGREDVGDRRAGPAAGAEAGSAAQHHEARPFLHGVDQELVLLHGEKIGRQVARAHRRCNAPGVNSASSISLTSPWAARRITIPSTWMSGDRMIDRIRYR